MLQTSFYDIIMKFIYLTLVVALLLFPVPAPSGSVTLNLDVDWIRWEAYFNYDSYHLSNDKSTARMATLSDRLGINIPVLAEDLERHYLTEFDWHSYNYEGIEDIFWPYAYDPLIQPQTHDERLGRALSSTQYLAFGLGHSIEEWDYFTYDFDSIPIENNVPMPANILLICLGLIGLAGFARNLIKG